MEYKGASELSKYTPWNLALVNSSARVETRNTFTGSKYVALYVSGIIRDKHPTSMNIHMDKNHDRDKQKSVSWLDLLHSPTNSSHMKSSMARTNHCLNHVHLKGFAYLLKQNKPHRRK